MTIQTNGDDCRESGAVETSREQFEAWITKDMSEMHKGIMLRRLECSDGYFHTVTSASWKAWRASRAAIEIEPLEGMTSREALDKGYMVDYANGYHDASYAYEARLKEVGISVKE